MNTTEYQVRVHVIRNKSKNEKKYKNRVKERLECEILHFNLGSNNLVF